MGMVAVGVASQGDGRQHECAPAGVFADACGTHGVEGWHGIAKQVLFQLSYTP
jgi:hypothetical protein